MLSPSYLSHLAHIKAINSLNYFIIMHKSRFILFVVLLFNLSLFAQNWTSANGPTSGIIKGFTIHNNTWFCATEFGVFKSNDMGQTWAESLQALSTSDALTVGNRVYIAAYEGVRYTDDDGGTWNFELFNGGGSVTSLADYGGAILAGTNGGGMFMKVAPDSSWIPMNQGLTTPYHLNIQQVIVHNNTSYIAEGSNIFKFNLATQTWDSLAKAGSNLPYPASFNCIASNGANLYTYVQGWGFYYSTNNGQTWTQKNTGLADINTNTMLKIVAHNNDLYIGGVSGFFKNDTYLTMNWANVANIDVYELYSDGAILMRGGEWDGFRYSDNNGATWKGTSEGLTDFISGLTSDGTNLFSAGYGTGVTKMNSAGTWSNVNNFAETGGAYDVCMHKGILFASRADVNAIQKSTNQGATWTASASGIPANVTPFQLISDGTHLFAACSNNHIYRSDNDGVTWLQTAINKVIVAIDEENGTLWAVTDSGIFSSPNNGNSWTFAGLNGASLTTIMVNNGRIIVGTDSYGVYVSDDNGTNWNLSTTGMNSVFVYGLYAIDNQRIVAGTNGDGIFYSGNNGNTWTLASNGLGNWYVYSFASDNNYLYAGTVGGSVFKSALSDYVGIDKALDNSLLSVFPNPTKGTINIHFENKQQTEMQLSIFDINGKIVYQASSDALMLREQVDLSNFPAGMYFVKVAAQKGSVSRSVVVE